MSTPNNTKLYCWKPQGHGQHSFYVCADSYEEALSAVETHIKRHHTNTSDDLQYEAHGWGTDYYEITVVEPLSVLENEND